MVYFLEKFQGCHGYMSKIENAKPIFKNSNWMRCIFWKLAQCVLTSFTCEPVSLWPTFFFLHFWKFHHPKCIKWCIFVKKYKFFVCKLLILHEISCRYFLECPPAWIISILFLCFMFTVLLYYWVPLGGYFIWVVPIFFIQRQKNNDTNIKITVHTTKSMHTIFFSHFGLDQ